jgi:RHS repeat-associated protein
LSFAIASEAVTSLGVNGTRAEIYSDQTFATTNGLPLNDGNNLFVTAGSNSAGALVVSTKMATKLPVTVSPVYDLNGNLVSDGLKGFEYDDANQLVRVTVTNQWKSEFSYDGLGRRRISKDYTWGGASWTVTNEVRYVWDGMAVLQERDGANAVQVTYTRGLDLSGTMQGAGGIGGLLARTDSGGTAYYHSDAGGNVTTMTDSSGNVVARYLYDPFGNLLAKSGAMADVNKYRFSSKEVHPNSGLYYYGYRFYEPNLQRWLNPDPIGIRGGMNFYGFVRNDPLNSSDYFGLDPKGHHHLCRTFWKDARQELKDVFDHPDSRIDSPGYKDHNGKSYDGVKERDYRKAVGDLKDEFLREKFPGKKSPSINDLSVPQARELVNRIKNAPPESTIGKYNAAVMDEMNKANAERLKKCKLKLAAILSAAATAVGTVNSIAESQNYKDALKAGETGDLGEMERAIDDLALEVAMEHRTAIGYTAIQSGFFWFGPKEAKSKK